LSVPTRGQYHDSERWETVRYALDSNARTFRLCMILFVVGLAPCVGAVLAILIHRGLLCGHWAAASSYAVMPG
jgi:hypothetical protein